MALVKLQSKNAVAQVILLIIILYHWLSLHKFSSSVLFFLNYLSFSCSPLLLSSALLSHGVLFSFVLSLLLLNLCPTLRNFCLLFLTLRSFWKLNLPNLTWPTPPAFYSPFTFSFVLCVPFLNLSCCLYHPLFRSNQHFLLNAATIYLP